MSWVLCFQKRIKFSENNNVTKGMVLNIQVIYLHKMIRLDIIY